MKNSLNESRSRVWSIAWCLAWSIAWSSLFSFDKIIYCEVDSLTDHLVFKENLFFDCILYSMTFERKEK